MAKVLTRPSTSRRAQRVTTVRRSPPPAQAESRVAEAVAVARYVADMTAQLEAMALTAHLDLLAYFLAMAKGESEALARAQFHEESAAERTLRA